MRGLLLVGVLAVAAAFVLGAGAGSDADQPLADVRTVRRGRTRRGGKFLAAFDGETGLDHGLFWTSGWWNNGQPFNTGWDPGYWAVVKSSVLVLLLRREPFRLRGWDVQYTGGEIHSHAEYGAGCYSVCMKAASPSGVATSFYIQNFGPEGNVPGTQQNEVDIEFIGKHRTKMQSNYFSRTYDPEANSGSGNEMLHELGFDVSQNYAAYSMRWREDRLDWWVNGVLVRTQHAKRNGPRMPDPNAVGMKIAANIWAVNKQAEEWAGPLDTSFYETAAHYLWIHHDPGENCQIKTECGPIPDGV